MQRDREPAVAADVSPLGNPTCGVARFVPRAGCLTRRRWLLPLLCASLVQAQLPDPPGQVKPGGRAKHAACLFAHMLYGDYWRLYYEQYPGVAYGLSVAASLSGPWFQASGNTRHLDWDKYAVPARVRHGCMFPITRKQYDALVKAFGGSPP